MSHSIAFNSLAYAKKLIATGVPEKQAEVQAEALIEMAEENLTTKRDLKEMEVSLKRDLKLMELRLTIRLGTMIAASVAVVATLVKIL